MRPNQPCKRCGSQKYPDCQWPYCDCECHAGRADGAREAIPRKEAVVAAQAADAVNKLVAELYRIGRSECRALDETNLAMLESVLWPNFNAAYDAGSSQVAALREELAEQAKAAQDLANLHLERIESLARRNEQLEAENATLKSTKFCCAHCTCGCVACLHCHDEG
jgi:hypothetical protein